MSETAELLLELLSEEIPARMQGRAADDLKRAITDRLRTQGLGFTSAEAFSTPRRLTLVVRGLPLAQPDVVDERKGPRVGAPEAAIAGFIKSAGLASVTEAEQRDTGKGVFYFAVSRRQGRATAAVLPEIIHHAVLEFPWPKSMRWGTTELRWVRPLHNVLALFAGEPLDFALSLGAAAPALQFNRSTRGHRFMAPATFEVTDFADYRAKLRSAKVMLDAAERRDLIAGAAARQAAAEGLTLVPDDGLLHEVAGLVEWPVVLTGRIDDAFMNVPREVLTTAMRAHQKYFSLQKADGGLAPRFLLVANLEAADGGKQIVAGNERVLRARLSDAKFFWDQDRQVRLETRVPALADIVFHAKLGTVAEKVQRLQKLAEQLAAYVPGAEPALGRRAALLAKADLTTGMVGEFPELQGIMGRYYAGHDGEPAAVATAIAEHYSPLGPNDSCPTAPVSVTVALADKLDTLVGFFAIDEKPTGSKDPFALRRAALGVIRLILENRLRVPLVQVMQQGFDLMPPDVTELRLKDALAALVIEKKLLNGEGDGTPFSLEQYVRRWLEDELLGFFADRLKVHLREQGVRHDLVSAVFSLGGEDDLLRLLARVEALAGFLRSDDGANLLVAYRRAANILRIEEKKDGRRYHGNPEAALLCEAAELELSERLAEVASLADAALQKEDFAAACTALAGLRAPVDAFFDQVTVNAEGKELRANRLHLLARIRAELDRVADFSKIEG